MICLLAERGSPRSQNSFSSEINEGVKGRTWRPSLTL